MTAVFESIPEQSPYPEDFRQEFRVAYDPGAKRLVIDYKLPTVGIIPSIAEYRFVKTKHAIEEKARRATEIKDLYRDVIAAVSLRCLRECFAADEHALINVVTFSGFVKTLDPAMGNKIRPYVISVRVARERFAGINLDHVDTKACLRNLGAQVSPHLRSLSRSSRSSSSTWWTSASSAKGMSSPELTLAPI